MNVFQKLLLERLNALNRSERSISKVLTTVSNTSFNNWCNGTIPNTRSLNEDNLTRLSNALEINPETLSEALSKARNSTTQKVSFSDILLSEGDLRYLLECCVGIGKPLSIGLIQELLAVKDK